MNITVIIAEDEPALRTLLGHLLSAADGITVVAEASDGRQALAAVREYRPQVLLLDLSLPGLSGLQVLDHLAQDEPRPRVLVLSGDDAEETQLAVAGRGAAGFLSKAVSLSDLAEAIGTVAGGATWYAPVVAEYLRLPPAA